ncbi:hypothetical protein Q1695_006587 [Nippostrongylus brasiliensis]|nr:hypothetical protein Q1695_006587 [Nippostrongylus brasiliensis]
MGDVDSGNTMTDFLDLERERGITIQLAAITFDWKKHRINLIDTPGHVDFTIEVERCARVMDGIVTVLDGSSGVQAQTLTVWRQVGKFHIPSVFFVNKLDKKESDFARSVDSVEQKLGVRALVTTIPYHENGVLHGVIDAITKQLIVLSPEEKWRNVEQNSFAGEVLASARENLCCSISECDSEFMSLFFDQYNGDAMGVPSTVIIQALRRLALSNRAAAITSGSALRCPASVRTVLDHIVELLPSPMERNSSVRSLFGKELCALVFKIGHDKRKGKLCFVRVYSGTLTANSTIFNSSRGENDGPVKLFISRSSELIPVSSVGEGNIAVVSGLTSATTGDTLVQSQSVCQQLLHQRNVTGRSESSSSTTKESSEDSTPSDDQLTVESFGEGQNLVLKGIDAPEPVYFCCVEPPSSRYIHDFERALNEIAAEDPSMRLRHDAETGQTIVETMGELHMDVVKNRLVRDYGLNVFIGPLQIAYREIITNSVLRTATVEDVLDDRKRVHSATLTMNIEPMEHSGKFKAVKVELPPESHNLRAEWLKAINEGCQNALHNGPILGFPVHDVVIALKAVTASGGRLDPAILSACAHKCVSGAIEEATARLVEPVMLLDITLECGVEAQPILHELSSRRAEIVECCGGDGGTTVICARLPLSEMFGFPTTLRTLSSGLATLQTQLADYQVVPDHDQINIVNKMKGVK